MARALGLFARVASDQAAPEIVGEPIGCGEVRKKRARGAGRLDRKRGAHEAATEAGERGGARARTFAETRRLHPKPSVRQIARHEGPRAVTRLEIPLGAELIEHRDQRAAGHAELRREIAARRQTRARCEAMLEDRVAQPVEDPLVSGVVGGARREHEIGRGGHREGVSWSLGDFTESGPVDPPKSGPSL